MQTPAPPISRPSTNKWSHDSQPFPRSIPDSARVLVAHAEWGRTAPHRTALLQALRGPSARVKDKTRPAHDTTWFLTSRPTPTTSLRFAGLGRHQPPSDPLTALLSLPLTVFLLHFILF